MKFKTSFIIYTIASFLNAGVPFLLLPILTKLLSPEQYGILTLYTVFIALFSPIISLNIMSPLQISYTNLNQREFASYFSSILTIPIIMFVFSIVFLTVFSATLLHLSHISLIMLYTLPIILLFQVFPKLVTSIYQITEQPIKYAIYQLSFAVMNISFTLYFLYAYHASWESRVIAILFTNIFFTFISLYIFKRMDLYTKNLKKEYFIDAIKIGAPLIIHIISAVLFQMSDRLFIQYFKGDYELGIFAVGAQIGMIALIIQQAFMQAWLPYLFKNLKLNTSASKIKIVQLSYISIILFMIMPFLIELASIPIFIFFIDSKYEYAQQYVFWVALGYAFLGIYKIFSGVILFKKKTSYLAWISLFSLGINLIFNYLFIKCYGTIGVTYATALTMMTFAIIVIIVANRLFKLPWFDFNILKGRK